MTVLYFHGNAGNIGHRIPLALAIHRTSGVNLVLVEYRGYGLSGGAHPLRPCNPNCSAHRYRPYTVWTIRIHPAGAFRPWQGALAVGAHPVALPSLVLGPALS